MVCGNFTSSVLMLEGGGNEGFHRNEGNARNWKIVKNVYEEMERKNKNKKWEREEV